MEAELPARTSGSESGALCAVLRECGDPEEPDVVRGVLSMLFDSLPEAVRQHRVHDLLYEEEMCYVSVLSTLMEADLRALGLKIGAARLVLNLVRPPCGGVVVGTAPVVTATAMTDGHAPPTRGQLRAFPVLQSNGLPERSGWRAYSSGLAIHLTGRASDEYVGWLAQIAAGAMTALPPRYIRGSVDDRLLISALMNQGSGSMPEQLVLLIDPKDLAECEGLGVYFWIHCSVMAVSDAMVAAMLAEFVGFAPVPGKKGRELVVALAKWKQVRAKLAEHGCIQPDMMCKQSLLRMVAEVPSAKMAVEALKARYVGKSFPLDELLTCIECIAAELSAEAPGSYALAVGVSGGAAGEDGERLCKFWGSGKCWKGSKCRFRHEGRPSKLNSVIRYESLRKVSGSEMGSRSARTLKCTRTYSETHAGLDPNEWRVVRSREGRGMSRENSKGVRVESRNIYENLEHQGDDSMSEPAPAPAPAPSPPPSVPSIPAPRPGVAFDSVAADAWWAAKVAGVSSVLGVSLGEAEVVLQGQLLGSIRARVVGLGSPSGGDRNDNGNQEESKVLAIVADTGATERVIGGSDVADAVNVRELEVPVVVSGATGKVEVNKIADLPGCDGLMDGSLLIPECPESLLPVVKTCREFDLAYEVCRGGKESRFHRDGETVYELSPVGDVMTLCGLGVKSNSSPNSSLGCDEIGYNHCLMPVMADEGNKKGVGSDVLDPERVVSSEPRWMIEHSLAGHPFDSRCDFCVQSRLRTKKAVRKLRESYLSAAGVSVVSDLTGPHELGVAGGKFAQVVVDLDSSWGYVGLQESRNDGDTLKSVQDMLVQLRADSGGRVESLAQFHHDDDKSYRGKVEVFLRENSVLDTHTGGYNPNANAVAERRIGMLVEKFRTLLLYCTGGLLYYEQLWDVGLVYACYILNTTEWVGGESPIHKLSGFRHVRESRVHVFGAYCLFHIPKENRGGKFRPSSEMGIWVGVDPNCPTGHWVVPIEWDAEQQCWTLYPVVTATSVRVYDRVFPLRLKPKGGKWGSQEFESFVDGVFRPFFSGHPEPTTLDETDQPVPEVSPSLGEGSPSVDGSGDGGPRRSVRKGRKQAVEESGVSEEGSGLSRPKGFKKGGNPFQSGFAEVESVVDKRIYKGVQQYKVKWKGWNNRYNVWRDESDLECKELIDEYDKANLYFSKGEVMSQVLAMCILMAAVGAVASPLPGLDVSAAVAKLARAQGIKGDPSDFELGYCTELSHMMSRRLDLLSATEAARVRERYPVVSMRMLLEDKKDGRKKARLVLQGFKEPKEWDCKSNASPVVFSSTIRSLLFMAGSEDDVISSIDVSVAFLQADEYGPGDAPRYVSYKPHGESEEYVFKLRGPVYGQRSAPRAWYETVRAWMVSEMGYDQACNDKCLFVHPETGHRVVLFVDDFLCRGSVESSKGFYEALKGRFDCKDESYLAEGQPLVFTGMTVSQVRSQGRLATVLDLEKEVRDFLVSKGLWDVKVVESPMPNKNVLCQGEVLENVNEIAWCKSVIGGLQHFVRSLRYDMAQAVSRVAQDMDRPTEGTVRQLERIAGYLKGSLGFSLRGLHGVGNDDVRVYVDSDHNSDSKRTSKSQSGVIITLNGVPIHWRSNRQPRTSLSPTEAEVYAMSVGVKDACLSGWVLEEMGGKVSWPLPVCTDSSGAYSFQRDSCPESRLRGCFDLREEWVRELQEEGAVEVKMCTDAENLADVFTKCLPTYKFKARIRQIVEKLVSVDFPLE